ncbi:hypothetical protein ABPG72_002984 [Tetrahymena utriculariae]
MSTEAKQKYLCDEILDKGYDANTFMNYLENLRNNGSDIEKWSYDELKILVENFQIDAQNQYQLDYARVQQQLSNLNLGPVQSFAEYDNYGTQKTNQDNTSTQNAQQAQTPTNASHPKEEEIKHVVVPKHEDDNNYKKIISCLKPDHSTLSEVEGLHVQVAKYEKKPGGLFSQAYIVYQVQTQPLNIEVFRRYNDFAWLHATLEKQYPQISIPPVPAKKSTRSFQPLFLSKRMAFMEKYLNKILKSPELKRSKFVEGFLTLTQEDAFSKLKKDGDKLVKQTKINQMITQNGEAQCVINQDINQFLKKTNDYLGNQDIIYKKVRKLCKQLIIDFDQLSTTLFSIGDCFSQSYNLSLHYNATIQEKNPLLEELYIHLNNMSISWGNNITTQIKLVQDNLGNWFKYYDNELKSMKEYLKIREQTERDYQNFKLKLTQKKERFFQLGDPTKWEIPAPTLNGIDKELLKNKDYIFQYMFPRETIQEGELRDTYGFYNNTSYIEIKRLLKEKIEEYSKHFNLFGQIQSDHITDLHVQWADLMTNMQSLGFSDKQTTLLESTRFKNNQQQENQFVDD